jgi:hypothetical protein
VHFRIENKAIPTLITGIIAVVSGTYLLIQGLRLWLNAAWVDYIMLLVMLLTFVCSLSLWYYQRAARQMGKKVLWLGYILSIITWCYGMALFTEMLDMASHLENLFFAAVIMLNMALIANALRLPAKTGITQILMYINRFCIVAFLILIIWTHTGFHTTDIFPRLQWYFCISALSTGLLTQIVGEITSRNR